MINGLIPLIIVFGWLIGCYFIFGFSDGQEVPYLNHFGLSYLKHNYWSNHLCVFDPEDNFVGALRIVMGVPVTK